MRARLAQIMCLMLAAGCLNEGGPSQNNGGGQNQSSVLQNMRASHDVVTAFRIQEILRETKENCPYGLNGTESNCAPVEIRFEKKPGKKSSARQRVLIIDSGMWTEALLTLSSRVLDFVEPDSLGRLHTVDMLRTYSRGAERIFHQVIGQDNPQISRFVLKDYQDEIVQKFLRPSPGFLSEKADHGFDIISTVAELSPDAEFVISQMGSGYHEILADDICRLGFDQQAVKNIEKFYRTLVQSYRSLILEYGLKFINLSSGHTTKNMNDFFSRCEIKTANDKNVFKKFAALLLEEFYKPLGSIEGVVLIQAGVLGPPHVLIEDDEDFPIDCTAIVNRIRVGEVTWSRNEKVKTILKSQSDALACIDVVLNKGPSLAEVFDSWFDQSYSEWDEIFCSSSLSIFPCQRGTSYAAPLMVSYMMYLSEMYPQFSMEELIKIVKADGPKAVRDPGNEGRFLRFVRDGRRQKIGY